MPHKMLRCKVVLERTGKGKSSLYADISAGLFTPPCKIGEQAVAWPESEVEQLNGARIAGWTPAAVRSLVQELIQRRYAAAPSEPGTGDQAQ